MKKIYKSPAIEAVEIEINSIMQMRSGYSPEDNNGNGVGRVEGEGIGGSGAQEGPFGAGRNRGFGNLWGDN